MNILDDHIKLDKILSHLEQNRQRRFLWLHLQQELFPNTDENIIKRWMEDIKAKDLIEASVVNGYGDHSTFFDMKWTGKVRHFLGEGGYKNLYLDYKEDKIAKLKDDIIRDLKIEQLGQTIFHLKYWWLILLFSGVIGLITANLDLIIKWLQ